MVKQDNINSGRRVLGLWDCNTWGCLERKSKAKVLDFPFIACNVCQCMYTVIVS